jgi:hypothetical protein
MEGRSLSLSLSLTPSLASAELAEQVAPGGVKFAAAAANVGLVRERVDLAAMTEHPGEANDDCSMAMMMVMEKMTCGDLP